MPGGDLKNLSLALPLLEVLTSQRELSGYEHNFRRGSRNAETMEQQHSSAGKFPAVPSSGLFMKL